MVINLKWNQPSMDMKECIQMVIWVLDTFFPQTLPSIRNYQQMPCGFTEVSAISSDFDAAHGTSFVADQEINSAKSIRMKRKLLLIFSLVMLTVIASAQKIFSCQSRYDADFKVFVVSNRYDADLLVYKVDSQYDTDTDGRWFFVDNKYNADKKIWFSESRYDADLLIFFVENRYDIGWKNRSKMHLIF